MALTRVFRSGNSQAVRIPRQFQLDTGLVEITKRGDEIVLRRPAGNLAQAFELLTGLSPDCFRGGRRQPRLDRRGAL